MRPVDQSSHHLPVLVCGTTDLPSWDCRTGTTRGYDHSVAPGPAEPPQPSSQLAPWRPPDGGWNRILKPDASSRRRRPLRRWEIVFMRVLLLTDAAFVAVVLAVGPPATSLWHAAAVGAAVAGLCALMMSGRRLLQLVGLRPPAGRDS